MEGIAGLHDTESYPDAELLPGLVVYRFDAPLIFANARMFGETVREIAEDDPDLRWIIVAAEPITDVDTTASDMLQELDAWLNARGVSLVFAEMKDPVRAEDRAVRAHPHHRPGALPPDPRRGRRGVHAADRRELARSEGADMTTSGCPTASPAPMRRASAALALARWPRPCCSSWSSAIRRWDVLLASVVSLGVAVVAAWYVVSRRGATSVPLPLRSRVVALVVFVVGGARERERSRAGRRARARRSVGGGSGLRARPDSVGRRRRAPRRRARHPVLHDEPAVRRGQGRAVRPGRPAAGSGVSSPTSSRPGDDLRAGGRGRRRARCGPAGHGRRGRLAGASSPRSRADTAYPSSSCPRGRATTSRSTWASTATTSPARWTPSTTESTRGWTWPRSTGGSSSTTRRWACTPRSSSRRTTATPRCRRLRPCCPTCWGPGPTPLDLHYTLPSGQEAAAGPAAAGVQQPLRPGAPARRGHARAPRRRRAWGRLAAGQLGSGRREACRAGDDGPGPALRRLEGVDGLRVRGRTRPGRWRSASTGRPWSSIRRCASPSARAPSRSGCRARAPRRSPAERTVRVTARPTLAALWQTAIGRGRGTE